MGEKRRKRSRRQQQQQPCRQQPRPPALSPRKNLLARRSWDSVMETSTPRHMDTRLVEILGHSEGQIGFTSEYTRQFARPATRALPGLQETQQQLLQARSKHPLYSEIPLTFWHHNLALVQGASATPPGKPSKPFHKNTNFTCPIELAVIDTKSSTSRMQKNFN